MVARRRGLRETGKPTVEREFVASSLCRLHLAFLPVTRTRGGFHLCLPYKYRSTSAVGKKEVEARSHLSGGGERWRIEDLQRVGREDLGSVAAIRGLRTCTLWNPNPLFSQPRQGAGHLQEPGELELGRSPAKPICIGTGSFMKKRYFMQVHYSTYQELQYLVRGRVSQYLARLVAKYPGSN